MKTSVDLVMFDLDGTLANTGRDLADAVNFTRAHFQLPALPDAVVISHVGRGVEHLLQQAVPEERSLHFKEVMDVFLERYQNHLLDATALYPHAREVLDYFRDKKRAVVSNKMYRLTIEVVRGLGIAEEFDLILGGDSVAEKKPHPALINHAVERFHIAPQRAVMIGDGEIDVEAGRRAGVITCGVTYGLCAREAVAAAQPDFLIDDLSTLYEYFC
ncbi:MAG: HAD-IA family hydrolase [Deltaproteobacteria bacterium]|nr:HAD-IA family hydrolase [Deltaproteobacteria bacterium]